MLRKPLQLTTGLLAAAYAALTIVVVVHGGGHKNLKLLVVQYGFLLPAVLCFLLANKGERLGPGGAWIPRQQVWYLVYSLLVLFLTLVVHQRISAGDENAYRFQARAFAHAKVAADAPPQTGDTASYLKEFRFHHHIIYRNKWFGKYPPGWPAVLAIGVPLNIDWLLNPLFGLLILLITYRIASEECDPQLGRLAVGLMVMSPYFLLNCMGYMPHPSCGFLLTLATLFYLRGSRTGRLRDFSIMLIFLGAALLIRPFTTLCMGVVLGIGTVSVLKRGRAQLIKIIGLAVLIGACAIGGLLSFNRALTGSYLRSTYALYRNAQYPVELNLNFRSILHNATILTRWSIEGTAFYAFPFIFPLAAYAVVHKRRKAYGLAAICVSLVAGYTLQTETSGTHFGERYYFEAFFAVAILGAWGWRLLVDRWRPSAQAVKAVGLVLLLVQVSQYVLLIEDAWVGWRPFIRMQDKIAALHLSGAVVFLRNTPEFSSLDFNQNEADWKQAPVFYLVDPGPGRRAALACALERSRWVVLSYDAKTQSAHVDELVERCSCPEAANKGTPSAQRFPRPPPTRALL